MTELLTAWAEIVRDFAQIGDPEIRRVQRTLGKIQPGERPLGAIHNQDLKRLWALAKRYDGLAKQAGIDCQHKADTEEQEAELLRAATRFAALEEVARDLFWVQAQDDVGGWSHSGVIGVRADWMLVFSSGGPQQRIAELIGGFIRPAE